MSKGYVIGLAILVSVVLAIVIWYTPTISSTFQDIFFRSSYTKIKVVMGQIGTYDQGDNTWNFFYRFFPTDPANVFAVASGFLSASYPTTQGATYTVFGLEIKVSEVKSDYIILLVKPT